jgi:hypothetical protein
VNPHTVKVMLSWTAAFLLLAFAWLFNLATYNRLAAAFHDPYNRVYALRGNVFSILALLAASL